MLALDSTDYTTRIVRQGPRQTASEASATDQVNLWKRPRSNSH